MTQPTDMKMHNKVVNATPITRCSVAAHYQWRSAPINFEVAMTIKRIHHINFIVENLEESIVQYEKIFGDNVFEKDDLPQRGVVTARAKIGEQWFVLVQPVDFDLPPGQHLRDKGEGFFLMSLEVESMEDAVSELDRKGISFTTKSDRKGLSNWWVRDLDKKATSGEQLQLCEERT